MYVRDAKNREEVWLLDRIEEMGLDATAFRSRDYVVAIDESENEKAGFGRIRIHKIEEGERTPSGRERTEESRDELEICELTSIGVLPAWRGQGVGAHVVERLVDTAADQGFETVYALTDEPDYLATFGFEPMPAAELPEVLQSRLAEKREETAPGATPMRIGVDEFHMPPRLREAFKSAGPEREPAETEPEATEDFGIDPDEATYKYDTGD